MNWGNVVNKLQRRTAPEVFTPRSASDFSALKPANGALRPEAIPSTRSDGTVRHVDFPKARDHEPLQPRTKRGPWGRPSVRLIMPYDPFDPRGERIRMLRTELCLRHEGREGANILAMLSPQGGEGRSQIAAELAVAFAQLGRRTLLVDADLRRPAQHILFMAKNHLGLAQAISRGESPRLRPVEGLETLSIVTAGPTPRNPLELLSDRCFHSMVEAWRATFDFVVIDTPPAARYADALTIASRVRRVVALTRAGHTPYGETRDMLRRLTSTGSEVLGAIINHF
jgi:protein-tyrosine kinase